MEMKRGLTKVVNPVYSFNTAKDALNELGAPLCSCLNSREMLTLIQRLDPRDGLGLRLSHYDATKTTLQRVLKTIRPVLVDNKFIPMLIMTIKVGLMRLNSGRHFPR